MKRPKLTLLLLAAAILGVSYSALAEEPAATDEAGDPGLAAMQAISFFEGNWEGEGWMRRGPTEPTAFRSTERVESRLGGRLLIVEGQHHDTESGDVVHHAVATISYNPETSSYRFSSHLEDGRSGDYAGQLEDGAFVWGYEVPQGKIRFTIRIADGHWSESGEFSADGAQWNQFFSMELDREGE